MHFIRHVRLRSRTVHGDDQLRGVGNAVGISAVRAVKVRYSIVSTIRILNSARSILILTLVNTGHR